jgi:hypothetical protein
MVPYNIYVVFVVDEQYTNETRDPKVSIRVCPYMGIYKLFIDFVIHLFL